ncbi:hypothetical protein CcCBS67573_g02611 [Chytriomyces confervae]|uniref:histidine kinase n=1 Tax=Chytriomyces confervae TaxID=246404 RepID=A0A507FIJ9_9FUNG|nr:hypothetical protein CcCBS67573_g02611 [Chytriomyces confervae]
MPGTHLLRSYFAALSTPCCIVTVSLSDSTTSVWGNSALLDNNTLRHLFQLPLSVPRIPSATRLDCSFSESVPSSPHSERGVCSHSAADADALAQGEFVSQWLQSLAHSRHTVDTDSSSALQLPLSLGRVADISAVAIERTNNSIAFAVQISVTKPYPTHDIPFHNAGLMGGILGQVDWAHEAPELGDIRDWPTSLKTAVSVTLCSKIQAMLLWGPQFRIMAYNDTAISTFGDKHPFMIGKPYKQVFPDVWPFIEPRMHTIVQTGTPMYHEDRAYTFSRSGFHELTYYTASQNPVLGDSGRFEGVITFSFETTGKVLGHSRVTYLRDLGISLIASPDLTTFWIQLVEFLESHTNELAFAVVYRVSPETGVLIRMDTESLSNQMLPKEVDPLQKLDDGEDDDGLTRVVCEAWNSRQMMQLVPPESHILHRNGTVLVMPVVASNGDAPALIVAGTRTTLPFDEKYFDFVNMIRHEVSMAYVNVQSLETAKARTDALVELDKVKTSFFMSMSHELRTPLGLIIGPVEDCLKDTDSKLTDNQSMQLELVRKNSVRLLKLVNSLLDVGRLNSGCMKAVFRLFDISEKTGQYLCMFQSIIEKGGLKYQMKIEAIDARLCYLDEEMWQKIVFNLLGNALKFTLSGHIKATLKLSDDGKFVHFIVEDTGVGIPHDQISRVFDQFHRVEFVGGRSFEGSGIGLNLVNDLVKLHGGSIGISSVVGQGTTMTVRIPTGHQHLPRDQVVDSWEDPDEQTAKYMTSYLEEAYCFVSDDSARDGINSPPTLPMKPLNEFKTIEAPVSGSLVPLRPPSATSSAAASSILIFLVDDNQDMRRYLGHVLSRHYSVEVFENGRAALNAMHRIIPALVVADVLMPVMDGLQMVKEMRGLSQLTRVPVILMSGSATGEAQKLSGFENGADEFLEKPVNSKELIIKIKMLLDHSTIRSNLEEDVRAQKQISAQTMKRYEQISRVSPVGLFTCNAEGYVIFANDKFAQIFGFDSIDSMSPELSSSAGSQGMFWDWIHPDERSQVLSVFRKCLEGDKSVENVEFQVRPPLLRKSLWVQMNAISDCEPNGDVVVLGSITDITVRKYLETERIHALEAEQAAQKQRADEAIQSKKESDKFIDMVCHELRNPLNGIANSNSLMKDVIEELSQLNENFHHMTQESIASLVLKCHECIEAIELCSRHQQTIADDVLNLSKLNMNLITISTTTPFNPKELVKKILSTFRAEMKSKQIKLAIDINDTYQARFGAAEFRGDPARLSQILINLVANAAKFTQKSDKREIRVVLRAQEIPDEEPDFLARGPASVFMSDDENNEFGEVEKVRLEGMAVLRISVTDSGIGMTENELALLFNQFQQASNKTYAEYGGSGLGLFISKRLADMMGGEISVESQKGVGSTFSISIPLSYFKAGLTEMHRGRHPSDHIEFTPSPMTIRSTAHTAKMIEACTKRKILVVDDNDINRMVLQKHLAKLGHESILAVNGKEAYEIYISQLASIPLILMDLEMPVMNGREAAVKIRQFESANKSPSPIGIIAVTGNARPEQVSEALESGMTNVLLKPFTRDQLSEIIKPFTEGSIASILHPRVQSPTP